MKMIVCELLYELGVVYNVLIIDFSNNKPLSKKLGTKDHTLNFTQIGVGQMTTKKTQKE